MRKIYYVIFLLSAMLVHKDMLAQCSVNISGSTATNQLNCNTTSISITANATGADTISYLWNTGDTSKSISVTNAGIYSVTITTKGGCISSSSIGITKDTTKPLVGLLAFPDSICAGSKATLVATGASSYEWTPGSLTGTTITVMPDATTNYTVVGTGSNGCKGDTTALLVVRPNPDAVISGSAAVCQGAEAPLIAFKGSGGVAPYSFTYNINSGSTQTISSTGVVDSVVLAAPTGVTGSFSYNLLKVTDGAGCASGQSNKFADVIVLAVPSLSSPKSATICDSSLFTYTATSSTTETSFSWSRPAVAGISNATANGSGAGINERLNNITDQPAVVSYVFTLSVGTGCITTDTLKVTVNPTPEINPIPDLVLCNGEFVSDGIGFSSSTTNTMFGWTNSNTDIGLPASGNGMIGPFKATNGGADSIKGNITVHIAVGSEACPGPDKSFIISVLPAPLLISSKTASVCDSAAFVYTALSSAAGTAFSWKRPFVAGISNPEGNGSGAVINERLNNTTDQPVIVNYIFTLSVGTGCVTTDTLKVTVNPTPAINSISNYQFCNNTLVNDGIVFSSTSPNASFSWSNNNTSIGLPAYGTANIPPFTAVNNSADTVKATIVVHITAGSDNCPGPVKSFIITVLPGPILVSSTSASVCNNSVFNYTAKSSANGTRFSWARAVVPGIENPAGAATDSLIRETLHNVTDTPIIVSYVFRLSTGRGCATTETLRVTVNPTPKIDPIADTSYCNGTPVGGINFHSSSPAASFTWRCSPSIGFGSGGSDNIPSFVAVNSGTDSVNAMVTVKITASSDKCQGDSSKFIITVLPAPVLTSSKAISICDNAPFTYLATSSAANTKFEWIRPAVDSISNLPGKGSTASIIEVLHNIGVLPHVVTYIFSMSTGTGCVTVDTLRVTVNPTPKIDPLGDITSCNGTIIRGINFSSSSPDSSFTWINSNTNIGLPKSGSGSIARFIAANTGSETLKATVTVKITASANNCPGDSSKFSITVLPAPLLTSSKTASVCDNAPFRYLATSSAANTKYTWTRASVDSINNLPGEGVADSINEKLDNAGVLPHVVTYMFTLSTGIGCVTTDSLKVTVNPTPAIDPIPDAIYCNGTFVNGINFSSSSPGASFVWNCSPAVGFGSIGSDSIPSFIASNIGAEPVEAAVTVKITASSDNCPGPDRFFKIKVLPAPMLTSAKTSSVCDNAVFSYVATSSAANTNFGWIRPAADSISNAPGSGSAPSIVESLHNIGVLPHVVNYIFTMSTGSGCVTIDTLKVTVNPTPKIGSVSDFTFCNNELVSPIIFVSSSPNADFKWYNTNNKIGLPDSGMGNIAGFIATDTGSAPIDATIRVSITAGSNSCPGPDSFFNIAVLPTPHLTTARSFSICDSASFSYEAASSAANTKFSWKRDPVSGVSNPGNSGTGSVINERLDNITDKPVIVNYIFTLSTGDGSGCETTETINVTVNPTPAIDSIPDYTFCNGQSVDGIIFTSKPPESSFAWVNDNTNVGLPEQGSGSISRFIATNDGQTAITANITVGITTNANQCKGADRRFAITVNPSVAKPDFTSLVPYYQPLTVCTGSENINFNINSPAGGADYLWISSVTDTNYVHIKQSAGANAVISFLKAGDYTITSKAINTANGGCSDAVSQQVHVIATEGINEKWIFKKQPGNLLIYPDNSLQGYQWGYDSIVSLSDKIFGPSVAIPGQVYQFFTPDTKFIKNGTLNETDYLYWVSLKDGDCYSKVYYNGPYVIDHLQVVPVTGSPQLQVIPNPNNGVFNVMLSGNIYGDIKARVYNTLGKVIYTKSFIKMTASVNERFEIGSLSGGVYFIELYSSDLKKVVSKFLVQH